MWVFEELYGNIKIGFDARQIYRKKTEFQDLRIYETERFGRLLMLDGVIQTTEKDEFIYHEMLTHPLVMAHPRPQSALVIGAGDGGIVRELLKYPGMKRVVLVEIDRQVIELSEKYLPSISAGAFSDKRLEIAVEDGAKYVARTDEKFDIAVVDSPDPIGVAKVLFSKKFYSAIADVLTDDGMMIRQTGSSVLQSEEMGDNFKILEGIFPWVLPAVASIPTYIGGFFSLLAAGKGKTPLDVPFKQLNQKYEKLRIKTRYYNPEIHYAAFALPNYMRKGLK